MCSNSDISVRLSTTAEVSVAAEIGIGTRIWHQAQIRETVRIGEGRIFGKGVYVIFSVPIGNRWKLQNGVYVYHRAVLADGFYWTRRDRD